MSELIVDGHWGFYGLARYYPVFIYRRLTQLLYGW